MLDSLLQEVVETLPLVIGFQRIKLVDSVKRPSRSISDRSTSSLLRREEKRREDKIVQHPVGIVGLVTIGLAGRARLVWVGLDN